MRTFLVLMYFVWTVAHLFSQSLNPYMSVKVDSILKSCGIDTSKITGRYLSGDIKERREVPKLLENSTGCSDYLIFSPDIFSRIPEIEYTLMMMRSEKTYDDYYGFLFDHDIFTALYRVHTDRVKQVVKIEHISIDINVDFGELVSTSYYKDGKLILYINNHCFRHKGELLLRKYEYKGWPLLSEEMIILSDNNSTIFRKEF